MSNEIILILVSLAFLLIGAALFGGLAAVDATQTGPILVGSALLALGIIGLAAGLDGWMRYRKFVKNISETIAWKSFDKEPACNRSGFLLVIIKVYRFRRFNKSPFSPASLPEIRGSLAFWNQ